MSKGSEGSSGPALQSACMNGCQNRDTIKETLLRATYDRKLWIALTAYILNAIFFGLIQVEFCSVLPPLLVAA